MQKPQFVDILTPIEPTILSSCLEEIGTIDWDYLHGRDKRRAHPAFATCTTLHLRISAGSDSIVTQPNSSDQIKYVGEILETKESPYANQYPKLVEAMNWAKEYVNGAQIARVMLVKLAGHGKIPLHIDPGAYFDVYKRFHAVFKTHPDVLFIGPPGSIPTHMPKGYLCQLNNIDMHGVISNTDVDRIHLIIDIETNDPRFTVSGPNS
jgi:hypothetical protein